MPTKAGDTIAGGTSSRAPNVTEKAKSKRKKPNLVIDLNKVRALHNKLYPDLSLPPMEIEIDKTYREVKKPKEKLKFGLTIKNN